MVGVRRRDGTRDPHIREKVVVFYQQSKFWSNAILIRLLVVSSPSNGVPSGAISSECVSPVDQLNIHYNPCMFVSVVLTL